MVNTQLLDEKIKKSGIKQNFIIENLGISSQAFIKKKQNKIPFRLAEIYVICDLVGITSSDEKNDIFFANNVD